MIWFLRRFAGWVLCAVVLLLTGCLEGFEQLVTSVRYDPFEQAFYVERRLVNIGERFFDCGEGVDCAARVRSILQGEASGEAAYAPAAQLRDRLLDTGAEGVALEAQVTERGLDIVVTYRAPLGTRAAEETRVHVEYEGRGRGGRYRLVVDAQDRMTMDRRPHRVRRRAQGSSGLLTWREEWVLRTGARDLVLRTSVASSIRSVLTHGGVADVVASYASSSSLSDVPSSGELALVEPELVRPVEEEPPPTPATPSEDSPPVMANTEVSPVEGETEMALPEPEVEPTPVDVPVVQAPPMEPAPPPAAESKPPPWDVFGFEGQRLPVVDAKGSATTYVHEPQVVGAPLPTSWSDQLALLGARSERCYQLRADQTELVEGHAFLELSIADGEVTGTAVYGQMDDAVLMRCLRVGLESWVPPAVERHTQGTRWTLPVTFRNEKQRRRRRQ